MPLLAIDKDTEKLFVLQTRDIPAPGGGRIKLTGYKLMWRAFDFLVLQGNWPSAEIVALALRKHYDPNFNATDLKPAHPLKTDVMSKLEMDIYTGQPIDNIHLWYFTKDFPGTELDACVSKVVAELSSSLRYRAQYQV